MTVKELMEAVDRLHPNQFSQDDKLRWLNELEQTIWREIYLTHEPPAGWESLFEAEAGTANTRQFFPNYTSSDVNPTPPAVSPTLLAPDPYSKLYQPYLDAKIAYFNHEVMQQDVSAQTFNAAMSEFRNWWNKTHMPAGAVNHLHILDRTWGWS